MAKSSGIVAFVQIFQMAFALLRNKVVALLIGTAGFGIWSLYHTFVEMLTQFSILGIDQSGVREIARTSDDRERMGKTIFTFRTTIAFLSLFWGIVVFVFASRISQYLLNSTAYTFGIRVLSVLVFFQGISRGGYAILNGVRALRYLAYSQILAAAIGSIGAILLVWIGGEAMVAPALSVVVVVMAAATSFYVRKLKIKSIRTTRSEFASTFRSLITLGLGFTIAGVVSTIMTLLSRSYLSSHFSLDAVGIYQASWTISNLYIGIILNAMGIDFMPRISKVAGDNNKMNSMINQQIEFGIVLSVLGVSLVLFIAPLLLSLLYSPDFVVGTSIIRWQILGVVLRVVAFPFSYSIMACAKPLQYAVIQILFWTADYLLLMLFASIGGFDALGINYFVAYCGYLFMTWFVSRRNHAFRFTSSCLRLFTIASALIAFFWTLSYWSEQMWTWAVGSVAWLFVAWRLHAYLVRHMGINFVKTLRSRIFKK